MSQKNVLNFCKMELLYKTALIDNPCQSCFIDNLGYFYISYKISVPNAMLVLMSL